MSKEGDQLSPSVIHRLEQAGGSVTVSALLRYAEVLGLHPKELLEFPLRRGVVSRSEALKILGPNDAKARAGAFKTHLPLHSLKAAAGYFGRSEDVEVEGWVDLRGRPLDEKMFVVRAVGESMEPRIRDGDFLLMRADPAGTRQGKIVLAQFRGPADPETGGAYTVKVYTSVKVARAADWEHRQITLAPLNPKFEPIILTAKDEDDFRIVAECVEVLGR